MLFTSFEFFIFFTIVLILNWRLRNQNKVYLVFLLLANLFFYGFAAPKFIPLLLSVALANWVAVVSMNSAKNPSIRRLILWLDVVFCLSNLIFFKYFDLFLSILNDLNLSSFFPSLFNITEIIYPLGLSFFIFQGLSLAIDHYRNPELKNPSLLDTLIFVSFFPTLLSGPIQRANNFIPQIHISNYQFEKFNLAIVLIFSGLFKKIALASYLSENIVRNVFESPWLYSSWGVLAGIYGYSAQIYLDFSGYSDLALGIALLLGYDVGINFNSPYLASNIIDFWRRWHISLSTWLRDYLYISLGGNRRGNKNLNLMITQVLGGLWHGAHTRYLIWGFGHGLALVATHFFIDCKNKPTNSMVINNTTIKKILKILSIFFTFNFVSFMWIFFRAEDTSQALDIISMSLNPFKNGEHASLLIWLVIAMTIFMQIFGAKIKALFESIQSKLNIFALSVWCAFWIILILKLGPDGMLPFIYFQY